MKLGSRPRPRLLVILSHVAITVVLSVIGLTFAPYSQRNNDLQHLTSSRHLMSEDLGAELNCTPRSIDQFPRDLFTFKQKQQGAIILHVIFAVWLFAALAVVCDDYFVSSLELICAALNLKPDVAGATFMAAGSSAPELFTSIVGVFIAKSDVGLSTIVGSAVFNILFIVSMCGIFATSVIYLSWWPMFRDCIFYCFSVIALIIVMTNGSAEWYESIIFIVMYIFYIILMYFNERLDSWLAIRYPSLATKSQGGASKATVEVHIDPDDERTKILVDGGSKAASTDYSNLSLGDSQSESLEDMTLSELRDEPAADVINNNCSAVVEPASCCTDDRDQLHKPTVILPSVTRQPPRHNQQHPELTYMQLPLYDADVETNCNGHSVDVESDIANDDDDGDEEEWTNPLLPPKGCGNVLRYLPMLPAAVLFFFTIPDCRRRGFWRRLYFFTFVLSVVWIALMSYVLVWMVCAIGDTLGIPDTVMGVTLLAAGTSVPDAMSSVFVARDGLGDMAVSNTVGSNVFDILIGLGIPWFIQTIILTPGASVTINSGGMIFSTVALLSTVVFLFVAVYINKMRLDKKLGVACLLVYVVFITFSVMFETNVFGELNKPPCPRSSP